MTKKRQPEIAADGGTMDDPDDATLGAAAVRAQAELIGILVRLVLASVERDAAASGRELLAPHGTHADR